MIGPMVLGVLLAALTAGPPTRSADVVTVKLTQNSLADGLDSFRATLSVRDGWHLAAPAGDPATVIEFRLDGEKAWVHPDIARPDEVVRKDKAGKEYRAYQGSEFVGWLAWDDTQHAKVVAVRIRVIATDGKSRLPESVVTAELRTP